MSFYGYEFLHAPALSDFADIDIALGIHRCDVRCREFARRCAFLADAADHLAAGGRAAHTAPFTMSETKMLFCAGSLEKSTEPTEPLPIVWLTTWNSFTNLPSF
jgi:hypothetical protein